MVTIERERLCAGCLDSRMKSAKERRKKGMLNSCYGEAMDGWNGGTKEKKRKREKEGMERESREYLCHQNRTEQRGEE